MLEMFSRSAATAADQCILAAEVAAVRIQCLYGGIPPSTSFVHLDGRFLLFSPLAERKNEQLK